MSAATLDFEDVRVLEEKETFELINANEASTTPKQPPKMLTASTCDGVVTMNNIDVPSNNNNNNNNKLKGNKNNRNNGKLLLNFGIFQAQGERVAGVQVEPTKICQRFQKFRYWKDCEGSVQPIERAESEFDAKNGRYRWVRNGVPIWPSKSKISKVKEGCKRPMGADDARRGRLLGVIQTARRTRRIRGRFRRRKGKGERAPKKKKVCSKSKGAERRRYGHVHVAAKHG